MNPSSWWFAAIYVLIFFGFFVGVAWWHLRQRKDRRPFPDNLKLLRGPAESLRRQMARFDENIPLYLGLTMLVPVSVGLLLFLIAVHLQGGWLVAGLIFTLLALVASLWAVASFLVTKLEEHTNRYLGAFGERVVAEALEPLKARGCFVFHDVPGGDTKAPFNLDHVVVGPSGVFAIETKTRRKGRARDGFAAHEIIYDGQVLAYPWGEDRHGLEQAQRQALWLENWLAGLLGRRTPVQPILTFPGWMILRRGAGTVSVLNPKEIPAAIGSRSANALDARELDLIIRQLDARCRDVEY